eukprot:1528897-Prymnesium_polylepis.1
MSSASKVRQSGRRHSAALEQEVFHQKVGHVTRHPPVEVDSAIAVKAAHVSGMQRRRPLYGVEP